MSLPIVEHFNASNEDYHIEVPVDSTVLPDSDNPVKSDAIDTSIEASLIPLLDIKQYKELATPVTVGGSQKTTVEEALQGLAGLRATTPAAGSTKLLIAGGAYSDKKSTPENASTKNFTAQSLAAFFMNSPTPESWLGKVLGTKLGRSTWKEATGSITAAKVSTLCHANGIWVAGSDRGCWWSTDGKTWIKGTGNNTTYYISCVYYANGIWVATGDYGCWWSTDGKAWTQGTGGNTAFRMFYVYYANGIWVAGSNTDTNIHYGCWWSTDGKAWTQGTGGLSTVDIRKVYYADGIWVAATDAGVWWSINGKAWTKGTTDVSTDLMSSALYHANGLWVLGSYYGLLWSTDGKSWTCGSYTNSGTWADVYFANGMWIAGNSQGVGCYWSLDGKTWTHCTGANINVTYVRCVLYANGVWVAGMTSIGSTTLRGIWYSDVKDLL